MTDESTAEANEYQKMRDEFQTQFDELRKSFDISLAELKNQNEQLKTHNEELQRALIRSAVAPAPETHEPTDEEKYQALIDRLTKLTLDKM